MRRMIELAGRHYETTVFEQQNGWHVLIGDHGPFPAGIAFSGQEEALIKMGNLSARMQIVVDGDMVHIQAFDRTFALRIVDPMEQAAEESQEHDCKIKAPMPGMVIEVSVAEGERVYKGQAMITIESMKILTVIAAPINGEVAQIHFQTGQAFERNAVLITLTEKEE